LVQAADDRGRRQDTGTGACRSSPAVAGACARRADAVQAEGGDELGDGRARAPRRACRGSRRQTLGEVLKEARHCSELESTTPSDQENKS
jgi:hypothetical protein